jgi:outer membrane lipoprotein-sorting protein
VTVSLPRLLPLLACVAAASACASSPAPATAPTPPLAPATALDALERRLSTAHSFRFHARLATSGRIESRFEGTVVAGADRRMRFALQGAFGGKDVDALFTCDGTRMRGGHRGQPFDMDAAPGLREGIAVGFVRMGLTHDVARLAAGKTPDYIDGSARSHLEVVGAAHMPGEPVRGAATEQWTWLLYVDHQKAADETLWLDARSGLPLKRRVVVHFPEGDMDVGEEYDDFVVDGPVEDATFRIDP